MMVCRPLFLLLTNATNVLLSDLLDYADDTSLYFLLLYFLAQ